jgi:hypothetical protein
MKRSYIKRRSPNPVSRAEAKADGLIQQVVCRAGKCAVCGSTYNLSGHHVVRKAECHGSLYLLRFHPMNLVCMCQYCHIPLGHERREEFDSWLMQNRTDQWEFISSQTRERDGGMTLRTLDNLEAIIAGLNGVLGLPQ